MYRDYNYYPQQTNQQTNNYLRTTVPQMLKGRPVSCMEEARAASIDFDGSIFYFPDVANRCIYTKQINVDGTATLNLYELKAIPSPAITESGNTSMQNYVTKEELEKAITDLKQSLAPDQMIAEPAKPQILTF